MELGELAKDAKALVDRMNTHLFRKEWRAAQQAADELTEFASGFAELCKARQRINVAVTAVRSARTKEAKCSVS